MVADRFDNPGAVPAAYRPTMSQQEWDRRQREGTWKQLPPLEPKRPAPKPGTDYVARGLALGPVRRIDIDPVDPADIPPEKLAAPTLGAVRRHTGVTNWCDEARVMFAVELVEEAQRRIILERLDSIMQFLAVGATSDQAMTRIERLVADYHQLEVAA
jgi:hypothetical protein